MHSDARIESHTSDYRLRIQPLNLGIGIQLVEVANSQSQVGIRKQLYRLCLGQAHKERLNILLYRALF